MGAALSCCNGGMSFRPSSSCLCFRLFTIGPPMIIFDVVVTSPFQSLRYTQPIHSSLPITLSFSGTQVQVTPEEKRVTLQVYATEQYGPLIPPEAEFIELIQTQKKVILVSQRHAQHHHLLNTHTHTHTHLRQKGRTTTLHFKL